MDGTRIAVLDYLYAKNGSLLRVNENPGSAGARAAGGYFESAQRLRLWFLGPDGRSTLGYDGGQLFETLLFKGDTCLKQDFSRFLNGKLVSALSSEGDGSDSKNRLERFYDDNGQLIKEIIRDDEGNVIETDYYYYNDARKMIRSLSLRLKERLETTFSYNAKGDLLGVNYFRDGAQLKRETYDGSGSRVDEILRDGAVAARVYYLNDRKVKEEIIMPDGSARERDFK
jgi:antitoxin component YwqK of YwqJK toxin-antitoxin module